MVHCSTFHCVLCRIKPLQQHQQRPLSYTLQSMPFLSSDGADSTAKLPKQHEKKKTDPFPPFTQKSKLASYCSEHDLSLNKNENLPQHFLSIFDLVACPHEVSQEIKSDAYSQPKTCLSLLTPLHTPRTQRHRIQVHHVP